MGEAKTSGFIRAFQKTFGPADKNFGLRARKVEDAVRDLDKWTQHMEAENDPRGTVSRGKVDGLLARLAAAKQDAATGNKQLTKQAFVTLDQVKDDARAALKEGRIAAKKTPFAVDSRPRCTARPGASTSMRASTRTAGRRRARARRPWGRSSRSAVAAAWPSAVPTARPTSAKPMTARQRPMQAGPIQGKAARR